MKKLLFLLTSVLILISCEKDHISSPTVDQFVSMIKKGNYNSPYLPNFQPEDIERLLYYSNDFQIIEEFPINSISSYMPTEFRLGECLLWTVESVRLNYDQTSVFKKYPSLVPQLIIPGGTIEPQIASVDDLNRAYNLYLSWWTNNKIKDFADFRNRNPLKDAVLMWR
jgi:hypothetical protein